MTLAELNTAIHCVAEIPLGWHDYQAGWRLAFTGFKASHSNAVLMAQWVIARHHPRGMDEKPWVEWEEEQVYRDGLPRVWLLSDLGTTPEAPLIDSILETVISARGRILEKISARLEAEK